MSAADWKWEVWYVSKVTGGDVLWEVTFVREKAVALVNALLRAEYQAWLIPQGPKLHDPV